MNTESRPAASGDILVDSVADWLMTQALGSTGADRLLENCSLRLNAAGIPLWRSNLAFQVLHPLYEAVGFTWYRDGGLRPAERFGAAELADERWRKSPQHHIVEHQLPFLRRRLAGPEAQLDFPALEEIRDEGGTDYLAYMVTFEKPAGARTGRDGVIGSWVTDRPAGFSDEDIRSLMRIQQRLAVACKMDIKEKLTENVLAAYLGPDAGRQVLAGHIHRGDGENIHAVIWYSDMRNSSGHADTMAAPDFITLINRYFECTAGSVLAHDGEVLRFIGDAVLGIFPIRENGLSARQACQKAIAAATAATERMAAFNAERAAAGAEAIGFGLGLHIGDVMFGNIGVPERVEFSVIGPAANEVARLENLTKSVGRQVLVSDRFAETLDLDWDSMGTHQLRGVGHSMEVFAPPAK